MTFSIRLAKYREVRDLGAIEVRARSRFSEDQMSTEHRSYKTPHTALLACRSQGLLWVADAPSIGAVGFCAATQTEDGLHVLQMSVLPTHGRNGIGTRFLQRVDREASDRGLKYVTLTTFAHIAWNAPAYHRYGFQSLESDDMPPALLERMENERAAGLSHRVAMRKSAV